MLKENLELDGKEQIYLSRINNCIYILSKNVNLEGVSSPYLKEAALFLKK